MDFCSEILSQICLGSISHFFVYLIIALLMLFEGEVFLLIAGSLVHFDFLDFWPLVLAAILGTWLSDIMWYQIGARWGEKFILRYGRWFFITPERFIKMQKIIWKSGSWLILVSKFSYGLNHLFMVTAGAVKYDFKKFLKYQFFVSAVWAFLFIFLGKIFALSLESLGRDIKIIGGGILFLSSMVVLSESLLSRNFFARFNGENNKK